MFNSESFDNSLESFTLGDSQNITVFILFEDCIDSDFFFEKSIGEVDFLGDSSSVNLDFNNVVFLLSQVEEFHLSGSNDSDDGAIFFDSVEGNIDGFFFFRVFLLVFGESLLFGVNPVSVESSEGVFIEFLSPNSG